MQMIAQFLRKILNFLFLLLKQNSPNFQINVLKFENLVASFLHELFPFSAETTDLLYGFAKIFNEGRVQLTKNN